MNIINYREKDGIEIYQEILRDLFEGKIDIEIAVKHNINEQKVMRIIRALIRNGEITLEEIEQARGKREGLKEVEKQYGKIYREMKALERNSAKRRTMERNCQDDKGRIQEQKAKRIAERERRLAEEKRRIIEKNIEEASKLDVCSAKMYIEYCMKMMEYGEELSKEDIDLINRIILYDSKMITDDNINFMAKIYIRAGQLQDATRFLNQSIAAIREDERRVQVLEKALEQVKNAKNRHRAIEMLKVGGYPLHIIELETGIYVTELMNMQAKINASRMASSQSKDEEER